MYLFQYGQRIRQQRRAMGMTQAALAEAAGVSRVTINQIENGTFPDIGVKRLGRILRVLGLGMEVAARDREGEPDFIELVCTSANVSFRSRLGPEELASILLTGRVPDEWISHMRSVFDETSPGLLEKAMRQLAVTRGFDDVVRSAQAAASSVGTRLRVAA